MHRLDFFTVLACVIFTKTHMQDTPIVLPVPPKVSVDVKLPFDVEKLQVMEKING